jgi:hypothetical protein
MLSAATLNSESSPRQARPLLAKRSSEVARLVQVKQRAKSEQRLTARVHGEPAKYAVKLSDGHGGGKQGAETRMRARPSLKTGASWSRDLHCACLVAVVHTLRC